MTIGLNWNANHSTPTENLETIKASGATVYHVPFEYNGSGGSWSNNNALVEEAWKRGITILPTLSRTNSEGTRFLLESDSEWTAWAVWAQELVERYGINGSFWEGKANPTPITAWEVWNEPNLPGNNPRMTKAACEAADLSDYSAAAGACVQPQNYATFLNHTANSIQAGAIKKTSTETEVLVGGLGMPYGENAAYYLGTVAKASGLGTKIHGVAIHPYSFQTGKNGVESEVNEIHNELVFLGDGSKTLWITEIGWPIELKKGEDGLLSSLEGVTEAQQSSFLTESFNWIKSVAAADNIETVDYFNVKDFWGSNWDGYCGLLSVTGAVRPAWNAFRQQTLQSESSPPLIGVLTNTGEALVKERELGGKWTLESGNIRSIALANSYIHGSLIGLESTAGAMLVKQGSLTGEFVEEDSSLKQIAVASDPVNGPLIAVLSNSGTLYVKQGNLYGEWVNEGSGIKSMSVGTDTKNGPIIGVVTETGHALVKEGSLYGEWVEELPGVESISVASAPLVGPVVGLVTTGGNALVKEGNVRGEWIEESGNIKAISVAADRVNGALVGMLSTAGTFYVKQGNLRGEWTEESTSVKSIDVAADPYNGPLIGAVTTGGVALVKEGSLGGKWSEEDSSVKQVSVAG